MDNKELSTIRHAFLWNKYEILEEYNKKNQVYKVLELLEHDIFHFRYDKPHYYFFNMIPYLYFATYLANNEQKLIYDRIQLIRLEIHNLLYQRKEFKAPNSFRDNYKVIKKVIGKLDILSLSLTNSFDANFAENKFELFYYLIFSIKNITVLENIIHKLPHQSNVMDEKAFSLILGVLNKYMDSLEKHTQNEKLEHLDDLLYYDRVFAILLNVNKNYLTIPLIKRLDSILIEKNEFVSMSLQERYYYFIYKWKRVFQHFYNTSTIFIPEISNESLKYQYTVKSDFTESQKEYANYIYVKHHNEINDNTPSIFTIDSKGSLELDDGFSCYKRANMYYLGIHIANPFYYIQENDLLFQEASKRTTSIYRRKKTIMEMFPKKLGADLFSLNEGNVRKCISFYFDIDLKKRKIVQFKPLFNTVYIEKNDSYFGCSETLKDSSKNSIYRETLLNILQILPFLKEHYSLDEMYKEINRKNDNVSSTNIIGATKGESIIETLMIFTNHMVASFAKDLDIPFLYRNHLMNPFYYEDLENYRMMLNEEKHNSIYLNETSILQSMYPQSYYDTICAGHYGLGLSSYTHITSPIRRWADFCNIMMLQKFYFEASNNDREKYLVFLQEQAEYMNQKNIIYRQFIKEYGLTFKK